MNNPLYLVTNKIVETDQTGDSSMKIILVLAVLFLTSNASADWSDSASDAWKKTKEVTGDVIDASKDASGKALDVTKDVGGKALDASIDYGMKTLDASKEVLEVTKDTLQSSHMTPEEKFNAIWGEVLKNLEDGLVVFNKIKDAPDSSFFGEDKKSLRKDFNKILDEIIVLLDDQSIKDYRDQIDTLNHNIEEAKKEITKYKEKRVTAPRDHMVKTTKSGYDKQIKQAKQDIVQFNREIRAVHKKLVEQFRLIGLDVDIEQVKVLLSRVDSENIIQMSVVFDVLKQITKQLMELTQSSGEEVKTAKKYYGMHVVLLEMVIHMQDKYIEKINTGFLPKIGEITEKTVSLHQSTKSNIRREKDQNRRRIYEKNLNAQELTLKVARLYMDNLKSQRGKVLKAKSKAVDDFRLAHNTYQTVEVSSDLVSLLNTSQDSFAAVMNLQVPEIVPFESLEMQKKYQELSKMMQEK